MPSVSSALGPTAIRPPIDPVLLSNAIARLPAPSGPFSRARARDSFSAASTPATSPSASTLSFSSSSASTAAQKADAGGARLFMRAFLLSLVAILALISAAQAQTQTQPQVLRSVTADGKTATSTNVTVSLVHQAINITATVKWGTDATYSLGTQTLVVTRLSPTYSPIFELTGLVHGIVEEAADAGRLLKAQGFEFDLAFTSVLKRAIRTLWITLDEMDLMWLPVERIRRLNERHYGA